MAKITVNARGVDAPVTEELAPGEALLFGRSPDPARLGVGPVPPARLRTVTLPSPHVSGNHFAVWSTAEGLWVQDLASKNGTWLRLSPGRPVAAHGAEVSVMLAASGASTSRAGEPPPLRPAAWTAPERFARAVADVASGWLHAMGVPAEVGVAPASAGGRDLATGAAGFHLADGSSLRVTPDASATAELGWPAILDRLAEFVDEQNAVFDQESGHDEGFVLHAPAFREAHRKVCDAAQRGRRLLLLGPSGAGKERLAECFHKHSARHDAAFRPIHCGLVNKDMISVQLFGAVKGAYTGAVRDVVGAVEAARGGTIFLDEIAELDPRAQSALLRFLDRRGEYERLGDPHVRRADVQVVCATNADLRAAVARGEFREDLWYRFTGTVVRVPALRERPEDLEAYLRTRRLSPSVTAYEALSPEALAAVCAHPWPGNFRELDNFIQRLPVGARARSVTAAVCRAALAEGTTAVATDARPAIERGAPGEEPSRWAEVLAAATAAFEEDHAGAPRGLGDVRAFVDEYLRPLFVAHACGLADRDEAPGDVNYSALGRRIDVADGTTVKKNLQRFFERYRRPHART